MTKRRDAIDVARVLALLLVVFGHLVLAVIDRPRGDLRTANLLALHPEWAVVAALSPMPVFFAAAGWANAQSTIGGSAARLRALVGVGAVVVCSWSVLVIAAVLLTGRAGVVADGARLATQPLWFVAAYLPLAALGGPIARLASAHVVAAVGGALALLAAMDAARFAGDAPDWIGWPGFYLAWGVPWVLGAWWRSRHESVTTGERREGLTLALLGAGSCMALVGFAGYAPALIDAVPGARSNTTPPTLYTAVAALTQAGLLLAVAGMLDRLGHRWRSLWDRAGDAAVGVYVWHLTALALCAAVIASGLPVPNRFTTLWWLTRPVWWLAVLTVTLGFAGLTRAGRRTRVGSAVTSHRAVAGILLSTAGGAAVGLRGPRTVVAAIVCSALLVAGWFLLRPRADAARL